MDVMEMRVIKDITDFIFVEDAPRKADAIFIPGGSYPELPKRAAQLWKEGYAPLVVPSGRYSITSGRFGGVKSGADVYTGEYATECAFYTEVLLKNGVEESCILQEDKAQFTAENARYTRKLLDARDICPKSAIICCKGFHARRCLMYYQLCFPDTELLVVPVYVMVTKENWYQTEEGMGTVLGELARLGTQFTPQLMPEWREIFPKPQNQKENDTIQHVFVDLCGI